jgi:hypothetical protein
MTKKQSNTLDKIVLINSMIEAVERSESLPFTYNGGTYPYLVLIKKIKVKNQFVTIENNNGTYIDKKERYNLNKVTDFNDCYCLGHLNYTLNVILRTFKTTLKTT